MDRMVWSEMYLVGMERIDREHRHIFESLHTLCAHLHSQDRRAVIVKELVDLENQVRDHFAHEERLLDDHAYPGIERQRAQHKFFQSELRFLRPSSATMGAPELQKNVAFLGKWFLTHIASYDGDYRTWLTRKPSRAS